MREVWVAESLSGGCGCLQTIWAEGGREMVPYRYQVEGGRWKAAGQQKAQLCTVFITSVLWRRKGTLREVKCLEGGDPMSEQDCNPCIPEPTCFPQDLAAFQSRGRRFLNLGCC